MLTLEKTISSDFLTCMVDRDNQSEGPRAVSESKKNGSCMQLSAAVAIKRGYGYSRRETKYSNVWCGRDYCVAVCHVRRPQQGVYARPTRRLPTMLTEA